MANRGYGSSTKTWTFTATVVDVAGATHRLDGRAYGAQAPHAFRHAAGAARRSLKGIRITRWTISLVPDVTAKQGT